MFSSCDEAGLTANSVNDSLLKVYICHFVARKPGKESRFCSSPSCEINSGIEGVDGAALQKIRFLESKNNSGYGTMLWGRNVS